MKPLVGRDLGGASLTTWHAMVPETGTIGRPVWDPGQFLRDIELRLGLCAQETSESRRVLGYAARLERFVEMRSSCFFAGSFERDPLGTARQLLTWRDELVEAGWEPKSCPDVPRLDSLAAIEELVDPKLPLGKSDRLRRVAIELERSKLPLYEELHLTEPRHQWPHLWQRLIDTLEEAGTVVREHRPAWHLADAGSDLGRVQRALLGERTAGPARGDGSLVLLRGTTSHEAAEGLGAVLRQWRTVSPARRPTLVITGDVGTLDGALERQGFPRVGHAAASPWRPVLQVLPLLLEWTFEPRDPERLLELLTLQVTPFRAVGWKLAHALAEAPGIGNPVWTAAKQEALEQVRKRELERRLEAGHSAGEAEALAAERRQLLAHRIESWLEAPAAALQPAARLAERTEEVLGWLRSQLVLGEEVSVAASAYAQALELLEALRDPSRAELGRVELQQLLDETRVEARACLEPERAGRPDFVTRPGALQVPCSTVVWWGFTDPGEGISRSPWTAPERVALASDGVVLQPLTERLRATADGWRRPLLAAYERLLLVVPDSIAGEKQLPHPLWDEIIARMGWKEADLARLIHDTAELLAGRPLPGDQNAVSVSEFAPLHLPTTQTAWRVARGLIQKRVRASATSLETLVRCPLRYVLQYGARIDSQAFPELPRDVLLYGKLGHRLVEELHRQAAFTSPPADLERAARRVLDELIATEGMPLLAEGESFGRIQVQEKLVSSVVALGRWLRAQELRIVGVEVPLSATWEDRALEGRMDLVLEKKGGPALVLDLKWGRSSHAEKLKSGTAIQLAVYSAAHQMAAGLKRPALAGYFSLSHGVLLATDAAEALGERPLSDETISDTWERTARTVKLLEGKLAKGVVPVATSELEGGVLEAAEIPERQWDGLVSIEKEVACKYCRYGALCGQQWGES